MRINNFSKEFEPYFLHSVISYTFRVESFVSTKFCEEAKLQNLGKNFGKFPKFFVKNNFRHKSKNRTTRLTYFQGKKTFTN